MPMLVGLNVKLDFESLQYDLHCALIAHATHGKLREVIATFIDHGFADLPPKILLRLQTGWGSKRPSHRPI